MNFNFKNVNTVKGNVEIICSKSILQRLIILGSFCNEELTIDNVSFNDDILACFNSLNQINQNLSYDHCQNRITIKKSKINYFENVVCNVGNSGTTFRILAMILTSFDHNIALDALSQLRNRNMDDVFEISSSTKSSWPLKIVKEKYNEVVMNGKISSQYISGMIMAMCLFNPNLKIKVVNPSSIAYINLTIDTCKLFGFNVIYKNGEISLNGRSLNRSKKINCEGDWTHGINFLVLQSFYPNVKILNLNKTSLQADAQAYNLITNPQNNLKLDANDFIDSIPILCLFFGLKGYEVEFYNTKRLMYKESNRIDSTLKTLAKFNIDVKVAENKLMVLKSNAQLKETDFDSFDDHRICFLIVIGALILKQNITIKNSDAICKSYPKFYEHVKMLVEEK